MKAANVFVLAMAAAGLSLAACGGGEPKSHDPEHLQGVDYPEWVLKGSGAFGGESGRVFYGVGSVSGIKNHALARTTADNRARAEIAKIFETYSASLMKDYQESIKANGASEDAQLVTQAIKTFSAR